jgi:hypothetical protein
MKDSGRMAGGETGEQKAEWWGNRDFLRFTKHGQGYEGPAGKVPL